MSNGTDSNGRSWVIIKVIGAVSSLVAMAALVITVGFYMGGLRGDLAVVNLRLQNIEMEIANFRRDSTEMVRLKDRLDRSDTRIEQLERRP